MRSITLKLKTLGIGIAIFILAYIALQFLLKIPLIHGFYQTIESFIYFQIFTSTAHPSEHIIIIDEKDNSYNRDIYAKLISGLDRLDANVIAFDVLFAGNKNSMQDAALVTATQKASNKIIHAIEFLDREKHTVIPDRFHLKTSDKPSPDNFIENAYGAILPFDELLKVTKHLGVVAARTDIAYQDNQYFPMIAYYNDRLYPSMPLIAVMKFLDYPTDLLPALTEDEIELSVNSNILQIPIDAKTQTLINFILPLKFSGKTITFEEALKYIDENSSLFRDKIILIGNSFESTERTHGPHFQSYPNLFIYASLISQILNGEGIRQGILESLFFSFVLVILGIGWLIFISTKFTHINNFYVYLFSFVLLLFIAIISIKIGVRVYVIFPYALFCFSHALSKQYYEKKLPAIGFIRERIIPLDYYVSISPKRKKEDTYPVTLIASPAGEDYCELKFPLKEHQINKIRQEMAQNFRLDIKTMKEFGASLFNALFQPEIRDQYDKSLGMVYTHNTHLRIKLRIDAPDLACYPWEYMYDGDQTKEFLALHKNISVTRFLAIQEPVPTISTKPPLKILVIISSPDHADFPKLAVEKEKKLIKDALRKLLRSGTVQLRFLKKATLNGLSKVLKRKVDIIHFVGHGGYSEPLGGGCLVFEGETGGYELINIDRLSKLLEGKPIRMVVLNACQTATITESDISLGVAHGLVKIGVPAVIAMQFSIPDTSAIEFAKEFYTILAETFQVDRAVSEARKKMFINLEGGRIDWGIPVLFMRKDDGVIF